VIANKRGGEVIQLESILQKEGDILQREAKTVIDMYFKDVQDETPDAVRKRSDLLRQYNKDPDASAEAILQAMLDVSRLVKREENISLRAYPILASTAWPWKTINNSSRRRQYKPISRCVIVEKARVMHYRKAIVTKTSVAHLRHAIAEAVASETLPVVENGVEVNKWSFWDEMAPKDITKVPVCERRTVRGSVKAIEDIQLPSVQQKEIERIIKIIQESSIATITGKADGDLEQHVGAAMEKLIVVSILLYE
jgi:hypothetical protein